MFGSSPSSARQLVTALLLWSALLLVANAQMGGEVVVLPPLTLPPLTIVRPTVCPYIPGYIANADRDHAGDDILNAGSVWAAMAKCDLLASCQGFNSKGWLKKDASPLAVLQGVCFYTKVPTPCQNFPGFTSLSDVDRLADNIGNFAGVAASFCRTNAVCKAFNSYGWAKKSASPTVYSRGTCLYVKRLTVCPFVPGYFAIADVGAVGTDLLTAIPASTAAAKCDSNSGCVGYNNDGVLKSSVTHLLPWLGSCYYVKVPTVCKPILGYTATPDVDRSGDDIGNYGANATAKCESDPNCKAFNSNGWIKRSASPLTVSRGTCFYTKAPTPCQQFLGYTSWSDIDRFGDDIGNYGGNAANVCSSNTGCLAFNSNGWCKRSKVPQIGSRGTCLYLKN